MSSETLPGGWTLVVRGEGVMSSETLPGGWTLVVRRLWGGTRPYLWTLVPPRELDFRGRYRRQDIEPTEDEATQAGLLAYEAALQAVESAVSDD